MKILTRFFYINDNRFCITFLLHLYLWEHKKKYEMKINQLIKDQESFREDSDKSLLYL